MRVYALMDSARSEPVAILDSAEVPTWLLPADAKRLEISKHTAACTGVVARWSSEQTGSLYSLLRYDVLKSALLS